MTKKKLNSIIVCFLVSILVVLLVSIFVFFDNIFTYSVSRFTEYDISFVEWNKSIFDKNEMQGLKILSQEQGFILKAENAQFFIDVGKFFKKKEIFVDFELKGVRLSYPDGISKYDITGNSLYSLFVGPDQKFNSICSLLLWDNETFSISGLNADSKNIKVFGNCLFSDSGENANIDIKVSISSVLASALSPEVIGRVLVKEDSGWYTTVIKYKGNTALLRALYQFSESK